MTEPKTTFDHSQDVSPCRDGDCPLAQLHEADDERWCEAHGAWLIGNPCGWPDDGGEGSNDDGN